MKARKFLPLPCVLLLLLSSCGGQDVVTYSEYRRIRPNMPIDQVERIIGHKGRVANDDKSDGAIIPNPGEIVYAWQNKDGSNLSVVTLNGKVVSMSETGLSLYP